MMRKKNEAFSDWEELYGLSYVKDTRNNDYLQAGILALLSKYESIGEEVSFYRPDSSSDLSYIIDDFLDNYDNYSYLFEDYSSIEDFYDRSSLGRSLIRGAVYEIKNIDISIPNDGLNSHIINPKYYHILENIFLSDDFSDYFSDSTSAYVKDHLNPDWGAFSELSVRGSTYPYTDLPQEERDRIILADFIASCKIAYAPQNVVKEEDLQYVFADDYDSSFLEIDYYCSEFDGGLSDIENSSSFFNFACNFLGNQIILADDLMEKYNVIWDVYKDPDFGRDIAIRCFIQEK